MQKLLSTIAGTAVAVLFSSSAFSQEVTGLIKDLAVTPNKEAKVVLQSSDSSCGAITWRLNLTDKTQQDSYQNLLMALAAGKKLVIQTDENCGGNILSATVATGLQLSAGADYSRRFEWLNSQQPNLQTMSIIPILEQYLIEHFGATHNWPNITETQFTCSKQELENSLNESGNASNIRIDPGMQGKIGFTLSAPPYMKGKYLFNFNLASGNLRVEIEQKPPLVPNDSIWSTIEEGLTMCEGK